MNIGQKMTPLARSEEAAFFANQLVLAKDRIKRLQEQLDDCRRNHEQLVMSLAELAQDAEPGECREHLRRLAGE